MLIVFGVCIVVVEVVNPLLFEMMRSFVTLARTLNLSHAVQELKSTRQTVRRHISLLEEALGADLFRVLDRRYDLTEAGERALPEARDILLRSQSWVSGEAGHLNGLFHMVRQQPEQSIFVQQHPITEIWNGSSELLRCALQTWAQAEGKIAHEAFDRIRPYQLSFRHEKGTWLCVEIGEKSSYATWYGRAWSLSSIGRSLPAMPEGDSWSHLLSQPYEDVRATGGVRFDHVHTNMVRDLEKGPEPMSYARLLMGCQFPDKSFSLVSIIERTHDIQIDGLSDERRLSMSSALLTNFRINELAPNKTS